MMVLHKEHMGSARREGWLRKNYWEFIVFLKKKGKHFQYVHRVLALIFRRGWWRKAVLSSRWSWNTCRCSNCCHLWSQKLLQVLGHALKKPQKTILRRRARSKSRSFIAELLSVSEPSCSTISITSIPSPVDEATNDSSISCQPVNEGKRNNISFILVHLFHTWSLFTSASVLFYSPCFLNCQILFTFTVCQFSPSSQADFHLYFFLLSASLVLFLFLWFWFWNIFF